MSLYSRLKLILLVSGISHSMAASELVPFQSHVISGETIGNEVVTRMSINTGTNEFMFQIPNRMVLVNRTDGLMLASPKRESGISLRILSMKPDLALDHLVSRMQTNYPNAAGIRAYEAGIAGKIGTGFELHYKPRAGGERLVRALCVPGPAGILELILDAAITMAKESAEDLDAIIVSFRSNEHGRIEVIKHSDKT